MQSGEKGKQPQATNKSKFGEGEMFINYYAAGEEVPVNRANQVIVQNQDEEIFLSFFAVSPPVIFGPVEVRKKQFEGVESLTPQCVGRMAMTPSFARKMIAAVESHLKKMQSNKQVGDPDVSIS